MSEFDKFKRANEWDQFAPATPDTRTVLEATASINPDDAAKASKLSKQYPMPEDALLRTLKDVELQAAIDQNYKHLSKAPRLSESLRRSPFTAAQTHDDIPALARIESSLPALAGASVTQAVLGIAESTWRTPDTLQRMTGYLASTVEKTGLPSYLNPIRGVQDTIRFISEGRLPTGDKLFSGTTDIADLHSRGSKMLTENPQVYGNAFADLSTLGKNADQALRTALQTGQVNQLGQVMTSPDYWASFVAQAAPSLYAAIKSGGSTKFLGWMEGMEQSNSAADFERRTGQQISDADFSQAVMQTAIVNSILEKTGLDKVMGAQGKGISGIFKAIFGEGSTEALQQVNTNLAEMLSYDKGKELLEGVVASFMGGAGAGGGIATVTTAASKAQDVLSKRAAENTRATQNASKLKEAFDAAAAAKLRTRNPETFRDLVQEMTDGTEGAPQSIYIDGQVLAQAVQSLPAEQIQEAFPNLQQQIADAIASNSVVELPVAEVLTVVPGSPLEKVFVENARLTPDSLSLAEAQQAGEKGAEFIKNEADRVMQQAADQEAWQQSVETVRQTVLDDLNTSGRWSPEVNEPYAALQANFFSTMAARTNQTPEQLYEAFSLRVAAERARQGEQEANVLDAEEGALRQSYGNAPNNLMGFAKGKPSKAFGEQGYKVVQYVRLTDAEGNTTVDAITGLNGAHALERARRNWTTLEVAPITEQEATAVDPTIAQDVADAIESGRKAREAARPEKLNQAAKQKPGPDAPGAGLEEGNKLGFWPALRVKLTAKLKLPEKPLILTGTNNKNAAKQIDAIDAILKKFPKATESTAEWTKMMAYALGSTEVPVPPYAFIRDLNGTGSLDKLRTLTQGQIDDASHGFENAAEFRRAYLAGELGVETTGKLFMWSFLSRGVSPYTQEALFIDAFEGADKWIAMAARGEFTEAVFPEYEAWAKSVAPAGSGQPGAGATHNLNAFGQDFLFKMSRVGKDGKTHMQRLHDMMADANQTGKQIRREFATFGEGVGIDNKVVSFTLLVAGFNDVMVLDRVQIRQLWDDGRFNGVNLYDGVSEKRMVTGKDGVAKMKPVKIAGSSLNNLAEGARGILVYEAIERGLEAKIKDIYTELGRPQDASIGRYHWETWVADSQQEASHGTLGAILADAKGDDQAIASVSAKEGEYGAYEYGALYNRDSDGTPWFGYVTPTGGQFAFSVPAFRAFLEDIKRSGTGVVPTKFKVTESGNAPWYTRPEVNQERLDERARFWADRAGGSGEGQRAIEEAIRQQAADRERSGAADQSATAGTAEQSGPNSLEQGPRGTFSPSQLVITLNENADLSTFLHESGHFFLEVLADLAADENAPQQIKDDMAATLKWFGVSDLATWNSYTLDEKRPYHERWAESFEQYLFEGKAPTPELQPLFRRFRAFMLQAYKSFQQFMNGRDLQLSDDIRQVFDRLIATDEQIAEAEEAAGLLPDFEATNEAIEKLQSRSLRDLKWTVNARSRALKALQKEAANLRKAVEAEVRAEVEKQPIYRAIKWLKKGETTDPETGQQVKQEKGFRLNTGALAEMFGSKSSSAYKTIKQSYVEAMIAEHVDWNSYSEKTKNKIIADAQSEFDSNENIRRAYGYLGGNEVENLTALRMTAKDGMHPDMVADMFGFESGDALVRNILAAEPMASVVEGMTDQRMLENYGELATAEAIEEAANEAVHNEARARSLATELKAQADMMNERQDTGRVASNGRPITVNAITEAAKQFALNLAARRRINDLRRAAWQHRSAEARAGKAWRAATAKGDTQAAVQAKQDQLLNNYAVKALQEAQAEAKKILEFFKKVTTGNNEKIVKGGRDPDVVNAMRAILAAYGVAPRLQKSALEYMEAVGGNDPAMYGALKPSLDAALGNAMPIGEMTMEELRGLNDELRAMWDLAKRSRQSEIDGKLVDRQELEEQLQARMQDIGVPDAIGEFGAPTKGELSRRKLQHAGSLLRRAEQWAEGMDGAFGGPFLRYVYQPIKEAADRYRAARVTYRKKFQKLVDDVAPYLVKEKIQAPELNGYEFGRGHKSIGHAELLHAILHTGNESNKRKLLLGRGWATENEDGTLDTSKWDAFIERMHAEGKLTQAHYDFVQGVWDLLEDMKPLAQKTHRDVYGRYFAEITASPVQTPFGTYRGGYVPAQVDTRIVQDKEIQKLAEAENESMAYSFPAANKGFTKSRTEYNRPLLLDLRTLGQHIDKVLLFSHMQSPVTDVNRLLSSKGVSYSLGRIDPTIYAGMLTPWLSRSARQVVETPAVGDGGISRVASVARNRAGMALMLGNISNALQQTTGFLTAMSKLKSDDLNSYMLRATARFMKSPRQMAQAVADSSEFMANRMENEIAAMNDAIDDILLDANLYEKAQAWTQKHAYFLQVAMANTMEPIIWTAGYNAALEKGMSDKDAVRYADGLIRQTQGSTLPEDVSRMETGPAWARMFTQFAGYFNMMANTTSTGLKQIASELGLRKGAGKALGIVTLGLLMPIWVAEAIAVAMRGGPDDEDDDGYLDDWLAAVFGFGTIKGMFAMVPGIGQLGNAAVNRFNDNPADDRVSMSPAVSLLEAAAGVPSDVYTALTDPDKLNRRKAVRDVASLVSIFTGLPGVAIARPLGYLAGVDDDKIEPTSGADMVRGLVTGTPSPESKVK